MGKILIAEDDMVSQKIVSRTSEKMGHTVFISPNGKHAYDSLKTNNDFDLLITDVMMPEMDGRDLIRTIRKEEKYKNLPIIIMSAYVGVKEISSFLETGATIFLPKPIDTAKLKTSIMKYLK